jgi:hypothetical protein
MMPTSEYRILTLISKIMDSVRFSDLGSSDIRFISILDIGLSNLGPPMAIPMLGHPQQLWAVPGSSTRPTHDFTALYYVLCHKYLQYLSAKTT